MKTFITTVCSLAMVLALAVSSFAGDFDGKKVLYIDSYHQGYAWSDGITKGIEEALKDSGAELKVHRMDTKKNPSEEFKKEAAEKAKGLIEEYKPDVVIASDDNAAKYLIAPYYKDSEQPFVFCGVNWDAGVYGFPTANITGMVEVTPIDGLLEQMSKIAGGDKIGFLAPDILTAQKEVENYKKVFGLEMDTYLAKDLEDYKAGFLSLQEKADIIILDSDGGLYDDQKANLVAFFMENTKKPTGSTYDFMSDRAIITFGKVAEEQGRWAAAAALEIMGGKKAGDIPVAKNSQGSLIINGKLIEKTGLEVPYELIEAADKVIQ